MDSLHDILTKHQPDEPSEIKLIKDYVQVTFQEKVKVSLRGSDIVIASPSAGLIATLRLRGPELARLCHTEKHLVFRIGN